ncbi:MAG: hypothetical protein A2297_08055 [Elusimicrobia bacterium RIFOXYB2_FULL_48_7]|nr:MAG: hypothetical protein A2297_08055 [Elusimicrobia bacterium RIFOXYB2_FULL_48_7]
MEINRAFKLLSLGKNASLIGIETAYRKLAVRYHPDRCRQLNKLRCRKMFVAINKARETLLNYYSAGHKENTNDFRRFYEDLFGEL